MFESPSSASKKTPVEIIGRMAGEYRLRRKLGEGGFGAVYEAEHPVLKRRAAVKVLHQAAGRDSEAVLRFISEAQAANQIRSRNIIDIFSFGQLPDGRHFYVMDLLEGEPLDRCLAREIRFDVPTTLQLLRPIAEALDAAHAAGVVHRDLKPQNIFLTWDSTGETVPKLLDFGMAKLLGDSPVNTLSGTPMGTPLYMSPEQARGDKVDGRSDVYALGVLCHELLTGRLPISGDSTVVVLMAHILQAPPRMSEVWPELPPSMDEPILRMLDKDPQARPATAGAALAALVIAAEGAGFVIPLGLPHLRRPAPVVASGSGNGMSKAQTMPATEHGRREAEADSLAADTPVIGRASNLRWRILGGLVALGLVAAYVIGGRMNAPVAPPAAVVVPASAATPIPAAAMPTSPPQNLPAAPGPGPASAGVAPLAAPVPPGSVELTLQGAPRGARVLMDGKPVGEAPGPIPLPFGQAPVQLTITAAGYEATTRNIVPDRPATVVVKLKKRGEGATRRAPIPRDLESPF